MLTILALFLTPLQLVLLVGLGYYYLLLIAAVWKPAGNESLASQREKRFAVAIPAHNEETVIGQTVSRLQQQDYPRQLYDIYVVADHCHDKTASTAREAGAICLERQEGLRGRKAYALHWLLQQIISQPPNYDAILIFDADSQVDDQFLPVIAGALRDGVVALQGQHIISNPGDALFSGLAAIDMRLNNLLRNQAKQNLGWSCRLMGDAMCLDAELIRRHGWGGQSLTEDREFEIHLLLDGHRVNYAPAAISRGQATATWGDAAKQRKRWYGGVLQMQRTYLLPLLQHFIRSRELAVLDRALELLLPPFSFLAALTVLMLFCQWVWPDLSLLLPLPWTGAMTLAWVLFPLAALWADGTLRENYLTLLYAPIYLVWRLWQGILVFAKRGQVEWIRTRRREEKANNV